MSKINIAIVRKFSKELSLIVNSLYNVPAVSIIAGKYCIAILTQTL